MSKETMEWLRKNVKVGYTAKRGMAWHGDWDNEDSAANHYEGAIPIGDIERDLFDWEPIESPLYLSTGITPDGTPDMMEIPGRKAIVPSDDPSHVFGIFKEGYQAHGYKEWLLGNVSTILGDTLNISSAGLLRNRAIAWVEISVPDTILTPEGIAFRPNLLATTSLDGSIATTYKRTVTLTVCDNTRDAALAERGQQYKRRHTRYSAGKLEQDKARDALALVHETADAVSEELARMCAIAVTDLEFSKVLDVIIPVDDSTTKTGLTVATRKREEMSALYRNDKRVAPWHGTAFGVVQASNTWHHHVKGTRGETHRPERNMLAAINGDTGKADAKVWDAIVKVLELTPA